MPRITPEFWANIQNKMREVDISGRAKSLSDYLGQNVKQAVEDIIPRPTKLSDDVPQGTFGNTPVSAPERQLQLNYSDKEPFPAGYKDYLTESADQYGIDPNILASLIASESGGAGYKPDLTGTSGEIGIAQIIPSLYYESAGFQSPEEYSTALQDPAFAIEQAATILKDLLTQYDGNYFDALASYNGGPTGYQTTGAGYDYARDTLGRVGMVDQYTPSYDMIQ
jgi:soluble lytic murein transglycosylase-like protein